MNAAHSHKRHNNVTSQHERPSGSWSFIEGSKNYRRQFERRGLFYTARVVLRARDLSSFATSVLDRGIPTAWAVSWADRAEISPLRHRWQWSRWSASRGGEWKAYDVSYSAWVAILYNDLFHFQAFFYYHPLHRVADPVNNGATASHVSMKNDR